MSQFEIDGWTWRSADQRLVAPWFADRERLRRDHSVKGGKLRDVFRVEVDGAGYYVKYHHPDSMFQKMRSGLAPKAKKEFDVARRLDALGIPVVAPVGWGCCGSRSMLLTREAEGAVSARAYWFGTAAEKSGPRQRFLAALGLLLQQLLNAHLYHPDLHLGNLLVTVDRRSCRLTLVDVYGVTVGNPFGANQRFAMLRIVGALRGELSRGEAIEFFRLHGFAPTFPAAADLWRKITVAEARSMELLWPKRRRKILACHPKYAQMTEIMGRAWRIRRGFDGQLAISPEAAEAIDWKHPQFEVRRLSAADAEALWLASFRLSAHRLPHARVLAWISEEETDEEIVLLERLDDPVVAEGSRRQELNDALRDAGIKIPGALGDIVLRHGRACLRDPARTEFAT